jgi:hypothetical protein
MYDLPSEDPESPGLPDEFHDLQPQLLSLTKKRAEAPGFRHGEVSGCGFSRL